TACARSGRFRWYRFGMSFFACIFRIVQSQTVIGMKSRRFRNAQCPEVKLSFQLPAEGNATMTAYQSIL
ncbi:MAG TPA: hypothetical protein VG077_06850, partial [Verrucomicrobiae bacterium]|nr:hypothetical protein [Verrucomicrobiae bacterium]